MWSLIIQYLHIWTSFMNRFNHNSHLLYGNLAFWTNLIQIKVKTFLLKIKQQCNIHPTFSTRLSSCKIRGIRPRPETWPATQIASYFKWFIPNPLQTQYLGSASMHRTLWYSEVTAANRIIRLLLFGVALKIRTVSVELNWLRSEAVTT